ncbi:MAG: 3-deoxy-D-manno-octulosonic acid transferase [Pseudomonadota bacterium]|nr:3-deoxy-D-manno-octulosonic acid transferase [Pseudomonadota bacterium]
MHLAYRLATWLALPALITWVALQARKAGGRRFLRQRLGWSYPSLEGTLWFHCASVGEVQTACPLVRRVIETCPARPVVITTNTATGAQIVERTFGDSVTHAWLPLDYPSAVDRLLGAIRPVSLLICETEIWPNLYDRCASGGIPVALFNARLSKRTLEAPGFVRTLYRGALSRVFAILARSEDDARGFVALGARPERVRVLGNLKYSACDAPESPAQTDPVGRPYWLAASTHDDEEIRLDRIWQRIAMPCLLPVIAPRHPDRGAAIHEALTRAGRRVARRSAGDAVGQTTDVYLADTLGELPRLMRHACFVFMGGSLIPYGGHNVLEPARLGKAIVTGPHTSDFREEIELLSKNDALIQVEDDAGLERVMMELIHDDTRREALGRRALEITRAEDRIAEDYLHALGALGLLPECTGWR